jgi:hypothetical protein
VSCNKYQPHVLVLPEDDANRQLANGFLLDPYLLIRRIQVLPVVGGWSKVLNCFELNHKTEMYLYNNRSMVLLIDFDDQINRLDDVNNAIPCDLRERVFVLGVLSEPEALRNSLGSYETIGLALAKDCREATNKTWGHTLLQHNARELDRLRKHVHPILFSS